eukprot:TRINITY_DN74702_c0_g1_i1.p1 TRINITY_DN74702_c0_g1~~TRINITY_DN74702_c0_g1_i1.p1  ORF type:complete len:524 (-),score=86.70 TRINITY_DN74702_c0_g1_i1:20-1591(-)
MAGYGASLEVDAEALAALPTGDCPESNKQRKKLFRMADYNGNGIVSLAEADRLIAEVLRIEGVRSMKPVINRAFHAARDIVPPVGEISPHYIDFHEFRYFLIYIKLYVELFTVFATAAQKKDEKYSDRRLSFEEFATAAPVLIDWGLDKETTKKLRKDPAAVYREMDNDGGGIVLFDEFAHWALWHHIWELDGRESADADMAEALQVLKTQKPNLCGKDLSSIQASKAKYRVDAKISGQGCLGGDESLSGAYDAVPSGGAELAAGRHYPGSLEAWKASLKRVEIGAANAARGPTLCKNGCGRPAFGRYATCCTRCKGAEGPHCRDCVGSGYAVCVKGCGRQPFGHHETCCTHCRGADGPHARDCVEKVKSLGPRHGGRGAASAAGEGSSPQIVALEIEKQKAIEREDFDEAKRLKEAISTLTSLEAEKVEAVKSEDFGRAKRVKEEIDAFGAAPSETKGRGRGNKGGGRGAEGHSVNVEKAIHGSKSSLCENGCGRPPFRQFKTCCTHCKGSDGPHAKDCNAR